MALLRRTLAGLVIALVAVGGGAAPALAAPAPAAALAPAVVGGDDCPDPGAEPDEGYAPPDRCELLLLRADAVCLEAAPVLDYAVEPVGTADETLTLTWVNPDGADVVQTGLPLSGQVYWPGTVVRDGVVVDWPGWHLTPEGTWAEHDAYDWTRPGVQVVLEVNPEVSTVLSYPPETAVCAGPPLESRVAGVTTVSEVLAAGETRSSSAVSTSSAVLAATGAEAVPLLAGAALLVLGGAALLLARRHHRAH